MSRILTTTLLAFALTAPAAAASATPDQAQDEAIGRAVSARLMDHDLTGVTVGVAGGIVTLRGTVRTLWDKQKAAEETMKVDNVISVVSELVVPRGETDEVIARAVAAKLQRYVFFSIFDDADVSVDDGVVTLTGRVTMPYKAEAFVDLAAHVTGVQEVRNEIRTLPVSRFDDQIRYAVARGIYGDDLFVRYATQLNPPIHIVVEHGAVTLAGVVGSEVERRKAEVIARSTFSVMSVTNKLRIEALDE